MQTKLIYVENGKITFTKKELEDLLKDTYNEGYSDGSRLNSVNINPIICREGNKSTTGNWDAPFAYTTAATATTKITDDTNVTVITNKIADAISDACNNPTAVTYKK